MDFKNMISNLFFDRARNVPDSRQLSEELVNSMYGTCFRPEAYRLVTLCAADMAEPGPEDPDARIQSCFAGLVSVLTGDCFELLYHAERLRVRLLLNYPAEKDGRILSLIEAVLGSVPALGAYPHPVVAACSRLYPGIISISSMLQESGDMLWLRFSSRENLLVHPIEKPLCPPDIRETIAESRQRLRIACSLLDVAAFREELDAFFALPDRIVAHMETRRMIRDVEFYMFDINRDLISGFADAGKTSREMVLTLREATSLEEYKTRYGEYLIRLMSRIIENSSARLSRPIRRAQLYIQEHCAEPLHLEDAAAHAGLTPEYFCSRFRQELKLGFSEYLNRCRIERAKTLLLETELPVVEIAAAVGYSGPRYFSRVFKTMEGLSPSHYRKAGGG